jgi:transcriptional regulator with XRE-family HTH domain
MTNLKMKAARAALGITQAALGVRVGCSQGRISQLELGHVIPDSDLARRIAETLGVAVDMLFKTDSERQDRTSEGAAR